MSRRLGHVDCGVYAKVAAGGTINVDDPIETERPLLI
ncbi:MAG: MOSC domain-containing protein, partial [Bradyrhizobium sp.]|nr:MOSC domain-containing protein [Bradyrhizobium sp.]